MRPKLLYVGMQYDYGDKGRGFSFEHYNFGHSLKSYCAQHSIEFLHYDFMERGMRLGLDSMTQELFELVKKEKPGLLFAVLMDFHRDPRHEIFQQISQLGTTTIHWFCDDHWRFEKYSSVIAPNFDLICTTARSALPKYQSLGIGNRVLKTQWACNHELYVPHHVTPDMEMSFVGQPHGNRREVVTEIIKRGINLEVFGYGWENRPRLPFHQMVRVFSRSKINLNLSNSSTSENQQIKGRNFEIPGTKSFLLTGRADNLEEYYEEGKEIVTFQTLEDLIDKAKFYSKNDQERLRIAENGYRRTLAEHTWHHRYDSIFEHAKCFKPATTKRMMEAGMPVSKSAPGPVPGDTACPAVSVVIPCYKQAHFLREAVESVVTQTFSDWEILIVNDGSPDNTPEAAQALIQGHPGKKIRLLEKPNGGLADARNFGIKGARGRYILPLDADDKILPQMLERTVAVLQADKDVAIAYTDQVCFGVHTESFKMADHDPDRLRHANQLNYCSLYRREVWDAVGGYNPNMKWGYEDWDFWVGCGEKGFRARRVPEPLFLYRLKENSMFTHALDHDLELRAQIVLNHPSAYRKETVDLARSILDYTAMYQKACPYYDIFTQPESLRHLRAEVMRLRQIVRELKEEDLDETASPYQRFRKRWKRFWRTLLPFKI